MAKKAVFVDMDQYPELYEEVVKLAKKNFTSRSSIIRQLIEKGLKNKDAGSGKEKKNYNTNKNAINKV